MSALFNIIGFVLLSGSLPHALLAASFSQRNEDDVASLVAQAQRQMGSSDIAAARSLLERAIAVSPNSPEANLLLGDLLSAQKSYPEAMDRFETVLAIDAHSKPAQQGELNASLALALQARRTGQQEAALTCLQHALEHLPDDATLLHALGVQQYDMGYLRDATETFSRAIVISPEAADNFYSRARAELDRQLFLAAERDFQAYLAKVPGDASAHYGYGHLLQMQQRLDEASKEFSRSIELQPQQTESYYQLGQIALDQHRDDEARPLFERTLARAAQHGGALTGMGVLAFRAKDYATADRLLKEATAASPEYQPAHYYLGLILAREGDSESSARELKVAVDLATKQQGKAAPVDPAKLP